MAAKNWACLKSAQLLGGLPSPIESIAVHAAPSAEQSRSKSDGTGAGQNDVIQLFVGLKDGGLMMYESCSPSSQGSRGADVVSAFDLTMQLRSYVKRFATSAVSQLKFVHKWNLLLCTVKGELLAHHLEEDGRLSRLANGPGEVIATEWGAKTATSLFVANSSSDLLCVASTSKLLVLRWKRHSDDTRGSSLFQVVQQLDTHSSVKALRWAGPKVVCVGFAKDYAFFDVPSKQELKFPHIRTGVRKFPVMCTVQDVSSSDLPSSQALFDETPHEQKDGASDGQLLLCKDDESYFIGFDGAPARSGAALDAKTSRSGKSVRSQQEWIKWSEQPKAMIAFQPFILGLLPRGIEVALAESCELLQTLPLPAMAHAVTNLDRTSNSIPCLELDSKIPQRALVFVASSKSVELIVQNPLDSIIEELLGNEDHETLFERALALCRAARAQPWSCPKDLQREGTLYVGAGMSSGELELLSANLRARYALFYFSESCAEPSFKAAYRQLVEARACRRLPVEFITMMFRHTALFRSPNAATTISLNLADLRSDLAVLCQAIRNQLKSAKTSNNSALAAMVEFPSSLALDHSTDQLVSPTLVESTEDLARFTGRKLSEALLLVFLPYVLDYRADLLSIAVLKKELPSDVLVPGHRLSDLVSYTQEILCILDTMLLRGFVLCDALQSTATSPRLGPGTSGGKKARATELSAIRAKMAERKVSFLRNENYCNVEECEQLPEKYPDMWEELLWLYFGKGMHTKALEWVKGMETGVQGSSPEAIVCPRSVSGNSSPYLAKAIEYLTSLAKEDIGSVFECSSWVFQKCLPRDSLRIFPKTTTDASSIVDFLETLDHDVISGLTDRDQQMPPFLSILYLEQVLERNQPTTPGIHNRLAELYISTILHLRKKIKGDSPVAKDLCQSKEEELEKALLSFLDKSQYYAAKKLIPHLSSGELPGPLAIALGRTGDHTRALAIFVHELDSLDLAEQYCIRTFPSGARNNGDVFTLFVQALVHAEKLDEAIRIAHKHVTKLDPLQVMTILPATLSIQSTQLFLSAALERQAAREHELQVVKQLARKEHLSVQYSLSRLHRKNVLISKNTVCANPSCKLPILAEQALARLTNGKVVHYACL